MDELEQLLSNANERLKEFNAGIRIFKRGQKLSLRRMLPKKKGNHKSQQTIGNYIAMEDRGEHKKINTEIMLF